LSKALFPDKNVYVSGFDWCKGRTVPVGINSLVRQILCEGHNNALSPADEEGVRAIELFQSQGLTPEPRKQKSLDVDGLLLERWLLKTAINLSFEGRFHIGVGMAESEPGKVSPYLLEVAFGRVAFTHLMGAHFLVPVAESLHSPHEIVVIPLIQGQQIGGFYFELRSQAIFLNLFPGHAPDTLGAISDLPLSKELLTARLVYRPPRVATVVNGMPSGLVRFHWPSAA